MRLLLINPNTSASMTEDMVASAQTIAPEAEIIGVTAAHGVAAIDGYRDDVLAATAVIEAIAENAGEFDGAIVGCLETRGCSPPASSPTRRWSASPRPAS